MNIIVATIDDTHETLIQIPALPKPTLEELRKRELMMEDREIERDSSPTDPVMLKLGVVLLPIEQNIEGTHYEWRCEKFNTLLGWQHAKWLETHQQELPALMNLPAEVEIHFPGLVVGCDDRVHGGRIRWIFYLSEKVRGCRHVVVHDLKDGVQKNCRVALSKE